jgi:hypothetical protein
MLIFWGAAIFGSVLFLLRTILFVAGGLGAEAHDGDGNAAVSDAGDVSDGGDAGGGIAGDDAGNTAVAAHHAHVAEAGNGAFRLLSLNSITGFIAMFGWAGLAAHAQYGLGMLAALGVGGVAGFATMLIAALLFHGAMKLRSNGAKFTLSEATGVVGDVYLHVPGEGKGRVSFVVNGVKHEADAVSDNGEEIPSFNKALVTRVIDSRTVAVVQFDAK